MQIALIGTAPSSIGLAPYDDPKWVIWACSPGAYFRVPRSNAWFETHRWEPGLLGKPESQKPWFTPEYVGWLYKHPCVWMFDPPADMPGARRIPHEALRRKYGDFFFTSTIAWMFAMAIEAILVNRKQREKPEPDMIGLWGVDMAAMEEYGYQRAGCQFFAQLAQGLDIEVIVPPESDLLTPPALYGLFESTHRGVKLTSRMREIQGRLQQAEQKRALAEQEVWFLKGAVDDLQYQMNNWLFDGQPCALDFDMIFPGHQEPAEELEQQLAEATQRAERAEQMLKEMKESKKSEEPKKRKGNAGEQHVER